MAENSLASSERPDLLRHVSKIFEHIKNMCILQTLTRMKK